MSTVGLTRLTRYELFMNAVEILERQDDAYMFSDKTIIKNMYYKSAVVIEGIEDAINANDDLLEASVFETMINYNISRIDDNRFTDAVHNGIANQVEQLLKKNNKVTYKDYFRFLLKTLTEYQNEMIDLYFIRMEDISSVQGQREQTFLSYAYYDKGLTLALYYLFEMKGGFLYVNWMWKGTNKNSKVTKRELERALRDSRQFLFLRTTNSELHVRGNNNSIRQWCAWEIGFYYNTKNQKEKFYTSFYDKKRIKKNDLLDSFNVMGNVVNGKVVS